MRRTYYFEDYVAGEIADTKQMCIPEDDGLGCCRGSMLVLAVYVLLIIIASGAYLGWRLS